MSKYIAGFIGTGNMGGALASAACKTNTAVLLSDGDAAKAAALAAQCGCTAGDNAAVASDCRFVFLGVKPQVLGAVVGELAAALRERNDVVLVSMAAGVTIDTITAWLGAELPVIRIMPNTPASLGEGMILYTVNGLVTEADETAFLHLMRAAGSFDRLPEQLIDAGSALSGCGPAFVYQFIEALADGGVECGLPRDKALRYAAQTVSGAAKMVLTDGRHPGELKDAVCSPGGSTIAGVHALEDGAFRGTVMGAVDAAFTRTKELGKQ
ncbi:MAG: pyrroline-5-carboxylate reductase [Clostridia bacterium]|nr:pyrroline-5-carboxylate reductase [Clostridia bacterium]